MLDSIKLVNHDIGYSETSIPALGPSEKHMFYVAKQISKSLLNNATVTANPLFQDGRDLEDMDDVTDTDPSEVAALVADPSIGVSATVYTGHDDGSSCGSNKAVESVSDFAGKEMLIRSQIILTFCLQYRHERYVLFHGSQYWKHIPFSSSVG